MLHNDVSASNSTKILIALSLAFLLLLLTAIPPLVPSHAASAPYMVKDINLHGSSQLWSLTAWKGKLIFQLFGPPHRKGVWISDGTAQGTLRLKSLDLYIYTTFQKAGKYSYFGADDGIHGNEPWLTDGTSGGTRLITELTPGKRSPGINFIGHVGKVALFGAGGLWRTNGKPLGTRMIAGVVPGAGVTVGNTFFFSALDQIPPTYGNELWKTDGTPEGTAMVKDIALNGSSFPNGMFAHAGIVWFFATDDSHTYGLWQSDGTENGTQMIKAIGGVADATVPIAKVGEGVFFAHRNLTTGRIELWHSDYTADGTTMIRNLGPNNTNDPLLYSMGNQLIFGAADETYKLNLWKSDGTSEGTIKIADTNIQTAGAVVGDRLFFSNVDESGDMELWQSDGTPEGTDRVADINPQNSADPHWLTRVNDTLFFSADDGTHGVELWAYKPE